VAVCDHRVGPLDGGGELCRPWTHSGEEAEGAVDVEPGSVPLSQIGGNVDRVKISGVHLARVCNHDCRRSAELLQLPLERDDVEPAGIVAGKHAYCTAADPEHPEGLVGGRVHVAAREDGNTGKPGEPVGVHVSPVSLGPPAASGSECREVRHCRPGRQDASPAFRQPEEISEPGNRDALELGGEWRPDPGEAALIERRSKPICAECRRRDAAGDEVEHARAGGRDGCLDPRLEELFERHERSLTLLRERPSERTGRYLRPGREQRALVQSFEVPVRLGRDEGEHVVELAGMHG
jgi:hypothetical protein